MASSPEDKENALPPPSEPDMAFLNHSQTTLLKQLPPDVDNKRLVRQKRRRTSPEDQKILEDVYQRNPRPDRAARAALAERVSLGNKELQIWFQNRRQSDRRRSRPIPDGEPSSSASLNSEADQLSDLPLSSSSGSEDADQSAESIKSSPRLDSVPELREGGKEDVGPQEQAAEAEDIQNVPSSLNQESQAHPSLFSSISNVSLESMVTIPSSQEPSPQAEKQTTGYIANRRGASFLQQERASDASQPPSADPSTASTETGANEESQGQRARTLQRTASLRLSTTADGKARIIDENNPSPSPPRVAPSPTSNVNDPPIRPPQLRRSMSAVTPSLSASFTAAAQNPGRNLLRTESGHGRSRDSRAWTFWCDAEERTSLQTQALAESSGSAASAIGLIRDRRRNAEEREKQAAQKAASGKRGRADPSSQGQNKRSKRSSDEGRSGLQRSHSSIPRLNSSTPRALGPKSSAMNITPSSRAHMSQDGKRSKPGDMQVYALEDDGDKENWLPGTRTSAPRHPHPHSDASTFSPHPLAENLRELSEAVGFGTPAATKKERTLSSASSASGLGDRPLSVGSGDDLDCVEGLLKLRGGTWG